MIIEFTEPAPLPKGRHHAAAAQENTDAASQAIWALSDALAGTKDYDKILLRAAAGAGKSVQLRRMVIDALAHPACVRVGVTAFQNRQVWPLARSLGDRFGQPHVCLLASKKILPDMPEEVKLAATVVTSAKDIPTEARIVLGTAHRLGAPAEYNRVLGQLGPAGNDKTPFDVLFVDEAWQMALFLFSRVQGYAPIVVGVGDVGQLPPIDATANPFRGDPGYNPYRAWPTAYEKAPTTFAIDLPAVWRPHGNQIGLWRAFYREWEQLDCVARPEDRAVVLPPLSGSAYDVWSAVATGHPTLLEVDSLDDPEAPDVDRPLLEVVEDLLLPLLEGGVEVVGTDYKDDGRPGSRWNVRSSAPSGDPLVVILATRNAAVDDAQDLVERLTDKLGLPDGVLLASTVDKWQGQTNRITIAIHPLSGADALDDFNSQFGRLAVACTRATHGLLMVTRSGLDRLLAEAPARPGTPLGEPGTRSLPRQTHQRILDSFSRGRFFVELGNSAAPRR
ncbi:DEAD/DEAH box helicase family protein [Parafrankia discariae]|uniref:hypothetical protein n=1 Tax=Parafrankia discariae TaxID=365528 RepID=UPI000372D685|nr:hypothetical protein [Parafrankia discariae]